MVFLVDAYGIEKVYTGGEETGAQNQGQDEATSAFKRTLPTLKEAVFCAPFLVQLVRWNALYPCAAMVA